MPSQSDELQDDLAVYADERPKFRHFFRCKVDGHRFHVDRLTADSSKVKAPKCPKCKGKTKESHMPDVGLDVAAGRAPATTSVQANAYDMAMKMCMEDNQATNILDHSRPGAPIHNGESTAPPLPAHLQKLSEGFWGGQRQQGKTKTARADLSAIYGDRAIAAQAGQPTIGQNFTAESAPGVAPILTAKPQGTSPVPDHRVVGSYNPTG
jgi:hypothetical protein